MDARKKPQSPKEIKAIAGSSIPQMKRFFLVPTSFVSDELTKTTTIQKPKNCEPNSIEIFINGLLETDFVEKNNQCVFIFVMDTEEKISINYSIILNP